ncbi:hypothetical protein JR316_0002674 [Psilocybe cubensis]|uniref:Uncharacterized protein n=2 Tax=Psilocybe cubensis TaxID=181762 RepID=A0A8H7Y8B6_PSICU|nr:hypothetical protein JR316_0002674 [Psilocybe cubensis]KAH9485759.1 hypothetical protein JR316_0002674 [Psilocybe cubensis]
MARILRLSPLQRNTITCIALFIITNIVVISQYWGPRTLALSSSPSDSDSKDVGHIFLKSESEAQEEEDAILNPPRILLVSALFDFPTARSSVSNASHQYFEYLPRFLGSITNDVYFYTTPDLAPAVRAAHGSDAASNLMVDTSFMSPFDIPPLKGRELVYSRMRNAARNIDTTNEGDEADIVHSPKTLALRNAKMFFLEHAIQSSRGGEENYSDNDYDYIFWVDLTVFNDDQSYVSFPGPARVETVWKEGSLLTGSPKEDLLFFPIDQAPPPDMHDWTEDMGPIETNFTQGSFFGGPPRSIKWLSKSFYAYHDYFIQLGFASALPRARLPSHRMGIVNTLLMMYPERFITVWPSDPEVNLGTKNKPKGLIHSLFNINWKINLNQASGAQVKGYLGECGDEQVYYQWWLSGHEAREAARNWWNGLGRDPRDPTRLFNDNRAAETDWWKTMVPVQSTPCHLSRVLSVESVLHRTFGEGWQVPTATVTKPSRSW